MQNKFLLSLLSLSFGFATFSMTAPAKDRPNAKSDYFYSFPEEASSEWAFQIPECDRLSDAQAKDILKCEKVSKHEMCSTKAHIRLSNVLNKESQDFKLIYHRFKTKAACIADRESALSGD